MKKSAYKRLEQFFEGTKLDIKEFYSIIGNKTGNEITGALFAFIKV